MTIGRIVIIPFLQGKLTPDGTLIEPDIDAILEKWLERHPEFRGRDYHVIRTPTHLLPDAFAHGGSPPKGIELNRSERLGT